MNTNTISFEYNNGRGTMEIDLDVFMPCTQRDFRLLLKTIDRAADPKKVMDVIYNYLSDKVKFFAVKAESAVNIPTKAQITAEMKQYISLANIMEKYGYAKIEHPDSIKLKKGTVYARCGRRGSSIEQFNGHYFKKAGLQFCAYKLKKEKVYHVLLTSIGISAASCKTLKECSVAIDESILEYIKNRSQMIKNLEIEFSRLMKENGLEYVLDLPEFAPIGEVLSGEKPKDEPEEMPITEQEETPATDPVAKPEEAPMPEEMTQPAGEDFNATTAYVVMNNNTIKPCDAWSFMYRHFWFLVVSPIADLFYVMLPSMGLLIGSSHPTLEAAMDSIDDAFISKLEKSIAEGSVEKHEQRYRALMEAESLGYVLDNDIYKPLAPQPDQTTATVETLTATQETTETRTASNTVETRYSVANCKPIMILDSTASIVAITHDRPEGVYRASYGHLWNAPIHFYARTFSAPIRLQFGAIWRYLETPYKPPYRFEGIPPIGIQETRFPLILASGPGTTSRNHNRQHGNNRNHSPPQQNTHQRKGE